MSNIVQKQIGVITSTVTLVTTAETLVAYTGRCEANLPTLRSIVKGWMLVLQGASGTGFQARIRRGNGITGALVAGATNVNLAAAAQVDTSIKVVESLSNVEYADYSLTVQLIGATGNGSVLLASIEVEMING